KEIVVLDRESGHYQAVFSLTLIDQATTTSSQEYAKVLHGWEEQPEDNIHLLWKKVGPLETMLLPEEGLELYQYAVTRSFEGSNEFAAQIRPAIVGNGKAIFSLGFDHEDPIAVSILRSFQFVKS